MTMHRAICSSRGCSLLKEDDNACGSNGFALNTMDLEDCPRYFVGGILKSEKILDGSISKDIPEFVDVVDESKIAKSTIPDSQITSNKVNSSPIKQVVCVCICSRPRSFNLR